MAEQDGNLVDKAFRVVKHTIKKVINSIEWYRWSLANRKALNNPLVRGDDHRTRDQVRVACILDEFSMGSLGHEMELVTINPNDWLGPLSDHVDIFLVEAFWRGNGGTWKGVGYDYNVKERKALLSIVDWCRRSGIPTVFWAKEDPPHLNEFLPMAKAFDHVFTTDVDSLDAYRRAGIAAKVMQFAAQPRIHNPIEIVPEREDRISFAGSYIPQYPERTKDFEQLAEAVSDLGLDIYDRNLERGDERYRFPQRYRPFIKGTLKGEEILRSYKGYRYGLNLNSIKGSRSMFARRVFELMACNTLVVSNGSVGQKELFGELTICSDDPEEVRSRLRAYREDECLYRAIRLKAMRAVMTEHTYRDRMDEMLKVVLNRPPRSKTKRVRVVTVGPQAVTGPLPDLVRQRFRGWVHDGPILNVDHDSLMAPYDRAKQGGELLALMYEIDHYGPDYLGDMSMAFFYSDAAVVSKPCHYDAGLGLMEDGAQYRWTGRVWTRAMVVDPSKMDLEGLVSIIRSGEVPSGTKCLSLDEFNYIADFQPGQEVGKIDV